MALRFPNNPSLSNYARILSTRQTEATKALLEESDDWPWHEPQIALTNVNFSLNM